MSSSKIKRSIDEQQNNMCFGPMHQHPIHMYYSNIRRNMYVVAPPSRREVLCHEVEKSVVGVVAEGLVGSFFCKTVPIRCTKHH